jgi:hypothetical protein
MSGSFPARRARCCGTSVEPSAGWAPPAPASRGKCRRECGGAGAGRCRLPPALPPCPDGAAPRRRPPCARRTSATWPAAASPQPCRARSERSKTCARRTRTASRSRSTSPSCAARKTGLEGRSAGHPPAARRPPAGHAPATRRPTCRPCRRPDGAPFASRARPRPGRRPSRRNRGRSASNGRKRTHDARGRHRGPARRHGCARHANRARKTEPTERPARNS